jgi:hypothetical protein
VAGGVGMASRRAVSVRLLHDDRRPVRNAGCFLWNAARHPENNISLIWFTVWSSVVHAIVMAVEAFHSSHHMSSGIASDVRAEHSG